MTVAIDIILPVFGVILIGYLAARLNVFGRSDIEGPSRFVFTFAIPMLTFRSLATADFPSAMPWDFLLSYYGGVFVVFGAGMGLARAGFGRPPESLGIYALGSGFSNTVLLGIPLVLTAFGPRASVPLFMIITFHSFLLMPAVTTILETGRGGGTGTWRWWHNTMVSLLRNPIILGLLAGVAVNLSGFELPKAVDAVTGALGTTATPGALFAMGASLSQYRVAGNLGEAVAVSGVKLLLHPLLVWGLATVVFDDEQLWASVAVLMAALPSGVMMFVFA